jgi:membrane protease YdiL (CAAX protease family)
MASRLSDAVSLLMRGRSAGREPPAAPGLVRRVFYGRSELRAGWRLVIFFVLFFTLVFTTRLILADRLNGWDFETELLIKALSTVGALFLASLVMGWLEERTIADYGLPWREALGRQFWKGAPFGFASITAILLALYALSVYSFGERMLQGRDILVYFGLYASIFVVGAVGEEFLCRGYVQFTLSTGFGFWPASIVTSAIFGLLHLLNSGEAVLGALSAAAVGFLFCLFLRKTGSLWMPIGFHFGFNWGESFFYGAPDSGTKVPHRFLDAQFAGPTWLTGGSVGPEGSVVCVAVIAGSCCLCAASLGRPHKATKVRATTMPVSKAP